MISMRRKWATKARNTGRAKEATKQEIRETERQARAVMQSDREIAIENGQKKTSTGAPRAKRHKQDAGVARADNPATDAEILPASEAPTGVSPQEQEAADASLAKTMDAQDNAELRRRYAKDAKDRERVIALVKAGRNRRRVALAAENENKDATFDAVATSEFEARATQRAAAATATAASRRKEDLARTAAKLQRLLETPGVRGCGGLENTHTEESANLEDWLTPTPGLIASLSVELQRYYDTDVEEPRSEEEEQEFKGMDKLLQERHLICKVLGLRRRLIWLGKAAPANTKVAAFGQMPNDFPLDFPPLAV